MSEESLIYMVSIAGRVQILEGFTRLIINNLQFDSDLDDLRFVVDKKGGVIDVYGTIQEARVDLIQSGEKNIEIREGFGMMGEGKYISITTGNHRISVNGVHTRHY